MKPEFVQILIAYLKEHKELNLRGLGRLSWKRHAVRVAPVEGYAAPAGGYATLEPYDGSPVQASWISHLKEHFKLSEEEAEAMHRDVLSEINTGINEGGEYEIVGFGAFFRKRGQTYFKPEHIDWEEEHFGLPVVPASVVTYGEDEKRDLFQEALVVHASKEEAKTDWSLWEVILALTITALILFFLTQTVKLLLKEPAQSGTTKIVTPSVDSTRRTDTSPIILPVEESLPDDVESGNTHLKDHYGKACVIIVGSFSKLANADQLARRVEAHHYTPYRQKYGNHYRVGVQFDCLTEDLYRKLFVLRGEFGKDAWILVYD